MKKLIPVAVAVVLIVIIAAVGFGPKILNRYSYSKEMADREEYFRVTGAAEAAIILQDAMVEEKALVENGICYFDLATVHKYLNDRFYADRKENLLLFTTPTDIVRTEMGSTSYDVSGATEEAGYVTAMMKPAAEGGEDTVYVAADYVKKYTNFSYELFTEPNHIQIYTEWNDRQEADVKTATEVRLLGGVKSPILTRVSENETVTVLEQMDTWSKVKTADAYIGYIENKRLGTVRTESMTPVTDYEEPEYTSLTREHKISLGWHAVYGMAGNDTLSEVVAGTKGLNVISPTWFKLCDNEGGITSLASASYVQKAHAMGLEVWGLVDDFDDNISTYEVLSSTTGRTKLITGLVQAAVNCGMDGINIDFEKIGVDTGAHFVQFLRELSIQCREKQLVLSVDNYAPNAGNLYYDREEQGVVADYIIQMGYDEHWHGSKEPGSVASIGFVEKGIIKTLEEVPAEKLINALPFYTILWKSSGTEITDDYVIMKNTGNLLDQMGIVTTWDELTCQNYGEVQNGDKLYQIWTEDEESISVKLNVMRNYNLGGVAVWRLGYEPTKIWDLISAYTAQ